MVNTDNLEYLTQNSNFISKLLPKSEFISINFISGTCSQTLPTFRNNDLNVTFAPKIINT